MTFFRFHVNAVAFAVDEYQIVSFCETMAGGTMLYTKSGAFFHVDESFNEVLATLNEEDNDD